MKHKLTIYAKHDSKKGRWEAFHMKFAKIRFLNN